MRPVAAALVAMFAAHAAAAQPVEDRGEAERRAGTPPGGQRPLFEVVIGGNGPLAGEDENEAIFPVGGGPSSFAVDREGRWWVLDAIGGRVLVLRRDGNVEKTFPFPLSGEEKRPTYRSDLELDGAGGLFLVDATARRIERWSKDGVRSWTAGSEKLPKGQGGLDFPQRVERIEESLFVSDRGSERLLRFTTAGAYQSAVSGVRAVPLPGGDYAMLSGERDGEGIWLKTRANGAESEPVAKLSATTGRTLHQATLVGATDAGDVVIALREGSAGAADRVRIAIYDRKGDPHGELVLPLPGDEATPVRRWRLTPSGSLAWFRVKNGRFQAFESALPARTPPPPPEP